MGKSAISHIKQGLLLVIIFSIWSCASKKTTVYPNPILLHQDAKVFIKYDYDAIEIDVPVETVDAEPTAYKLGLFKRTNPAEPFIEKTFFPGEPIKIILPRDVFNLEELGNVAVLTPFGGHFEPLEQLFTLPEAADFSLRPFKVKHSPAVIKIYVYTRSDSLPFYNAKVLIRDKTGAPQFYTSDSTGFLRIEIDRNHLDDNQLHLQVDTDGSLPPWSGFVAVDENGRGEKIIWLGGRKTLEKEGVYYRITSDLTPLKRGPENGAESIFFLSKGDRILVSKIAGDRFFGQIDIFLDGREEQQRFWGWVLSKNVEVVE